MRSVKAIETRVIKVTPSESDLRRIQQLALPGIDLDPETIFTGRMALANDQKDRSLESFSPAILDRFAETIPAKAVMGGHDYRSLPLGRFYNASVEDREGRKDLTPSYYLLNDDPITAKVNAGIVRSVSIGFEGDMRICDICEKDYDGWWTAGEDEDYCTHIVGREYEGTVATITWGGDIQKYEAVEGSFVWMGCQYNAETIGMNAHLSPKVKAAYLDRDPGRRSFALGLWLPDNEAGRKHGPSKEEAMANDPKDAKTGDKDKPSPEEAAKTARLVAAGEKYTERILKTIKDRYTTLEMGTAGEQLLKSLETADVLELEKAEAEAEALFQKRFPPNGKGVPESAGDSQVVTGGFNPLAFWPGGRRS